MSTAEFNHTKKELLGWIQSLTDDSILNLLHTIKLSSEDKTTDWWEELTENDRINILSGIKNYKQGEIIESKEFWKSLSNG